MPLPGRSGRVLRTGAAVAGQDGLSDGGLFGVGMVGRVAQVRILEGLFQTAAAGRKGDPGYPAADDTAYYRHGFLDHPGSGPPGQVQCEPAGDLADDRGDNAFCQGGLQQFLGHAAAQGVGDGSQGRAAPPYIVHDPQTEDQQVHGFRADSLPGSVDDDRREAVQVHELLCGPQQAGIILEDVCRDGGGQGKPAGNAQRSRNACDTAAFGLDDRIGQPVGDGRGDTGGGRGGGHGCADRIGRRHRHQDL